MKNIRPEDVENFFKEIGLASSEEREYFNNMSKSEDPEENENMKFVYKFENHTTFEEGKKNA